MGRIKSLCHRAVKDGERGGWIRPVLPTFFSVSCEWAFLPLKLTWGASKVALRVEMIVSMADNLSLFLGTCVGEVENCTLASHLHTCVVAWINKCNKIKSKTNLKGRFWEHERQPHDKMGSGSFWSREELDSDHGSFSNWWMRYGEKVEFQADGFYFHKVESDITCWE